VHERPVEPVERQRRVVEVEEAPFEPAQHRAEEIVSRPRPHVRQRHVEGERRGAEGDDEQRGADEQPAATERERHRGDEREREQERHLAERRAGRLEPEPGACDEQRRKPEREEGSSQPALR
jgi:hypothetical protein